MTGIRGGEGQPDETQGRGREQLLACPDKLARVNSHLGAPRTLTDVCIEPYREGEVVESTAYFLAESHQGGAYGGEVFEVDLHPHAAEASGSGSPGNGGVRG